LSDIPVTEDAGDWKQEFVGYRSVKGKWYERLPDEVRTMLETLRSDEVTAGHTLYSRVKIQDGLARRGVAISLRSVNDFMNNKP